MKDKRRELLKLLLQGKANQEEVVAELQKFCPLVGTATVFSYADEPGIYNVDDREGLTEAEMQEAIKGKNPFFIRIHRSNRPMASSEREVLDRIELEARGN